jgi:hypothetical protein
MILATVFGSLAGLVFKDNLLNYATISLALTTLEAVSHSGIDNGLIPVATALLLRLAQLG